jgi:hypothetical protein
MSGEVVETGRRVPSLGNEHRDLNVFGTLEDMGGYDSKSSVSGL